ncbi:probable Xaa-Pro aminopeptidase P [Tanacetum coccineum]
MRCIHRRNSHGSSSLGAVHCRMRILQICNLYKHIWEAILQIFEGATHVNVSHVNHDLSFGPKFPRLHNPLDDTNRILHGASRTFEYYIKHQLEANLPSTYYLPPSYPARAGLRWSELASNGSSAIGISMLDEVAWLLNLRGNDVSHSLVMYAYLIVKMDAAKLFVDNSKVTPEVMDYLKIVGIELRAYMFILSEIKSLAARGAHLCKNKGKNLSGGPSALCKSSPVSLAKAVKNDDELEGMRNSHLSSFASSSHLLNFILGNIVPRNVLILDIPSSFVIVIVVMVAVIGSWSGPLELRLKSRYIPACTMLSNR